ncbi:MBL fold metallo-hydrolase [Amycolatopsis rhabdoformis]|uniref:MBL fold metallo-hydrolase n=1 Tax=Amycolatopsis rhabdoformis TaxID=1448059 RepID=A0ABZ1HYM8_9PSEU|nr:MBL fold metallo-hydrolase [Amycolatopsis rhabdoformis]WSE27050.1 MBL fold metallo-hydrolase [Amycolatopsis rhabdoformis]
MSTEPLCRTCGMQYAEPREDCPICEDERQYVPLTGQAWTDLDTLRSSGDYRPRVEEQGPGVIGIGSEPGFAIGQRALLVQAGSGNFLWDCAAYLDDDLVRQVTDLGGITGIAISHPHYYSTVVEWAHAFDVPIYLHEADRDWIGRPDPSIRLWSGTTLDVADDLRLINLGVHFTGGTVLHWPAGEEGRGALLSGDIVQVIPDRTHVAFMYSYPNSIPERPSVVRRAAELLEPYAFEAIYGAFWDRVVRSDGHEVVQRSAKRYLAHVLDAF